MSEIDEILGCVWNYRYASAEYARTERDYNGGYGNYEEQEQLERAKESLKEALNAFVDERIKAMMSKATP